MKELAIKKMSDRVAQLEKERNELKKENDYLKSIIDTMQNSIDSLNEKQESVMKLYYSNTIKLYNLQKEYSNAITSAREIKKEYEGKMSKLISSAKKDLKGGA